MTPNLKSNPYLLFFIGLVLWISAVSFIGSELTPSPGQPIFSRSTEFLSQNWIAISLVLSELASLLPGPWNGIVQSILRALTKKARRNNSNH